MGYIKEMKYRSRNSGISCMNRINPIIKPVRTVCSTSSYLKAKGGQVGNHVATAVAEHWQGYAYYRHDMGLINNSKFYATPVTTG